MGHTLRHTVPGVGPNFSLSGDPILETDRCALNGPLAVGGVHQHGADPCPSARAHALFHLSTRVPSLPTRAPAQLASAPAACWGRI